MFLKTSARCCCAAALSPSLLRNSEIAVNSFRFRYICTLAPASHFTFLVTTTPLSFATLCAGTSR